MEAIRRKVVLFRHIQISHAFRHGIEQSQMRRLMYYFSSALLSMENILTK